MMVKKYSRKKPVIVEAMQFKDEVGCIEALTNFIDDQNVRICYKDPNNPKLILITPKGELKASIGDYIIKDNKGKFYSCKPYIFESVYEEV